MEVKAIGKPKPTPKWLKANEEIIPSDDYLIENYPDGTSVLTITNVQPDKIDQITFEAVSKAGVAKTTTDLQIEGILSYIFNLENDTIAFIWRKLHISDQIKLQFTFSLIDKAKKNSTFIQLFQNH